MLDYNYDVYAIGNALIDLQFSVSEQELLSLGLSKGSMRLVEVDEQVRLLEMFADRKQHLASGGSAANTVIAIQQLGGRAAYGCAVGEDNFSEFYLNEMKDLGVHLCTKPLARHATGTCIIFITPDSERTMNTHLGASYYFGAEHVNEDLIKEAAWLYVEGYLFSSDTGREASAYAVNLAKKHGTKVAVTFSDGFIVDVFGDTLRGVVAQSDLVFANFGEASRYTGFSELEEVVSALGKEVANYAITLGEHGAFVSVDGSISKIPGEVVRAVDTTGAGDMFAGGLLYGLTHGLNGEESGRLACRLAAKVVSQLGPRLPGDLAGFIR
jgi:sugar/nucleoside kinase (ribokinase family)